MTRRSPERSRQPADRERRRVATVATTETVARRRELAYAAARIMADEENADFERARRKAAARAGVGDRRCWPSNEEIQERLLEQRRLFRARPQQDALRQLRARALETMALFEAFEPRLIGGALTGTATLQQGIRLQLFVDHPEQVIWLLIDRHIPWRERQETLRYADGARPIHPVLSFVAGEIPVQLLLLPTRARRNPPLDPVSKRPERGASAAEVRALLDAERTERD